MPFGMGKASRLNNLTFYSADAESVEYKAEVAGTCRGRLAEKHHKCQ